jgi:hypothetical protein
MPYVEVPKYTEFEELKKSKAFKNASERAIEIRLEMDALDEELANLKDEVEADPNTTVEYEGWQIRVVDTPGTPRLDKKKLVKELGKALGSEAKAVGVLKKSMIPGAPKHYVMFSSPKEKKEEAGG